MISKLLSFLLLLAILASSESQVEKVLTWKQLTYNIPQSSLSNKDVFIQYNNVPFSCTHHRGRIFVAVARRRTGIPATLNVVDLNEQQLPIENRPLRPYPSLALNQLHPNLQPDPNRIVTVYRPRVDRCDRLWFVDTGMMEIPNDFKIVQRPSIWAIDLRTDQPISRYEIPAKDVDSGYGLTSITIDVDPDDCEKVFVYMSDLQTYRLIVYDHKAKKSWRFLHNYFFLNPLEGDFRIGGIDFAWDDGIFSIALGKIDPITKARTAYFHSLASNSEFSVSTNVLKNESNALRSYHGNDFKLLGYRGMNAQSSIHGYDNDTGVIIFGLIQKNGIGCWDTKKPFNEHNLHLLYRNDAEIFYINDLSIDNDGYVWFMTNSIIKFLYTKLDTNEFNFHIWRANIKDLIRGTICDPDFTPMTVPFFRPEFLSHNFGGGWGRPSALQPVQQYHTPRNRRQLHNQNIYP